MDFTSEQREQRVTEKVGLLKGAETSGYSDKAIPSWGDLQDLYESRWVKEKTKFQIGLNGKPINKTHLPILTKKG